MEKSPKYKTVLNKFKHKNTVPNNTGKKIDLELNNAMKNIINIIKI